MQTRTVSPASGLKPLSAFTLLELAVVLFLLVVIGTTLLPVLAKTRPNVEALQCVANQKMLCAAWRMYADDCRDLLVYSGVSYQPALDNYAWTLRFCDCPGGSPAGMWDTNADIVLRPLWPYTGKKAAIYRCPADRSSVTDTTGTRRPSVHSFNMNMYVGGLGGTDGGWSRGQRIFHKTTDLTAPGPAKTFVFMDLRPDQVLSGTFITDMTGYPNNTASYEFLDLPGFLHNQGCNFSFADGRAEYHHWIDSRTFPAYSNGPYRTPIYSPLNGDIAWLQDHATRPN